MKPPLFRILYIAFPISYFDSAPLPINIIKRSVTSLLLRKQEKQSSRFSLLNFFHYCIRYTNMLGLIHKTRDTKLIFLSSKSLLLNFWILNFLLYTNLYLPDITNYFSAKMTLKGLFTSHNALRS